jgi:hypothetical protein
MVAAATATIENILGKTSCSLKRKIWLLALELGIPGPPTHILALLCSCTSCTSMLRPQRPHRDAKKNRWTSMTLDLCIVKE